MAGGLRQPGRTAREFGVVKSLRRINFAKKKMSPFTLNPGGFVYFAVFLLYLTVTAKILWLLHGLKF